MEALVTEKQHKILIQEKPDNFDTNVPENPSSHLMILITTKEAVAVWDFDVLLHFSRKQT